MRRLFFLVLLIVLTGCKEKTSTQIASFESVDMANKVVVLLANYQIKASLSTDKDLHLVSVSKESVDKARKILTQFNFYFEKEDLNDLLESKFASLSKLEVVKGNLLESRQIYNKLSVIPDVLRANVVVTGDEYKHVSVLIMSISEISPSNKENIERFLRGLIDDRDTLTLSYFVQRADGGGGV